MKGGLLGARETFTHILYIHSVASTCFRKLSQHLAAERGRGGEREVIIVNFLNESHCK